MEKTFNVFKASFLILMSFTALSKVAAQTENTNQILKLDLPQCIELTLKNNNSRNSMAYAVKAAEAKIKQAQSGHYPSLDLASAFTIQDEDPNYIAPTFSLQIPAMNLGTLSIPPLTFNIPDQHIKMADRQQLGIEMDLVMPIFLGGKISAYVKQAEANLEIAKSDSKQNDDQIIFETKKLYYSVLLASNLKEVAQEAYDRMSATLLFTESLYQKGSGKVTKSDYLKNKTIVEAINGILNQLDGEYKIAKAALVNTMGLDWKTEIELTENDLPVKPFVESLEVLLENMKANNPYLFKVENGLNAMEAKIDESKSEYYPSIALMGTYRKLISDYDFGYTTKENKNTWIVGIGMQMNLFNGLRTSARVEEAKANYNQLSEQKELLTKGLTLKLQYLYYKVKSCEEKINSSKSALNAAQENRDLVERAYYSDIMELQELIQAQLTESMLKAQYNLFRYEYSNYEAELILLLSSKKD